MTLIGSFRIRKQFDCNLFFDYERLDAKIKTIFKGNDQCLESIEQWKREGFKEQGLYFIEEYVGVVSTVISDYEELSYDYL